MQRIARPSPSCAHPKLAWPRFKRRRSPFPLILTPPFLHLRYDGPYPYRWLDWGHYGNTTATPQDYQLLVLDNDYVRVTLLPELGGRVYQMIWKPTGHNELYQNPVIKPTHWGPLKPEENWWLAVGGMEWELPVEEHGYEWGEPWVWNVVTSTSGVTVTVHSSGDAGSRVPNAGDPMPWPIYKGRDFSRLGNWRQWFGFFERPQAATDLVGVYDTASDEGVARIFPSHMVRGTKGFGMGWSDPIDPGIWTDDGSAYVELHGGVAPTFWDSARLAAGAFFTAARGQNHQHSRNRGERVGGVHAPGSDAISVASVVAHRHEAIGPMLTLLARVASTAG